MAFVLIELVLTGMSFLHLLWSRSLVCLVSSSSQIHHSENNKESVFHNIQCLFNVQCKWLHRVEDSRWYSTAGKVFRWQLFFFKLWGSVFPVLIYTEYSSCYWYCIGQLSPSHVWQAQQWCECALQQWVKALAVCDVINYENGVSAYLSMRPFLMCCVWQGAEAAVMISATPSQASNSIQIIIVYRIFVLIASDSYYDIIMQIYCN